MKELDFSGKTVLVVGGTSGLGNGIAKKFKEQGATVEIWGTRASLADYNDERCDYAGYRYQQVDVTSTKQIDKAANKFASLDVLILSQGILMPDEYNIETFRKVVEVDLVSVMSCCMAFENALKAAKGSVVMMNSVAAYQAFSISPAYIAAKNGLIGIGRVLAKKWGPDQVRVNGIACGVVVTRMMDGLTSNPTYHQAILAKQPLGRLGSVEEVANVTLFLASPLASYITGQTIIADGGYTLNEII
jgi:3-oxoacyl-[acyl-carrier protein] reductase